MVNPKEKVEARKRLFATRFKTELCRTFEEQGSCHYESKCMFAHGLRELRTQDMNERDGLTSTNAVRRWLNSLARSLAASQQQHATDSGTRRQQLPRNRLPLTPQGGRAMDITTATTVTSSRASSSSSSSSLQLGCVGATRGAKPRPWRHEPYSWIPYVSCAPHQTRDAE